MVDEVIPNPRKTFRRQLDNTFAFINTGITIFLISLLNGYLYNKLSSSHIIGQHIDISVGYTTAVVGIVISLVIPGRLHLIKNLSLVSSIFILMIVQTLGKSAISLACILIALFHLAFIFLRRYLDYSNIPFSLIVGFKLSITLMVFFQQFLMFPKTSISPIRFNFTEHFLHLKDIVGTHEFEKLLITAIGSVIIAFFIKTYPRVPWNTILLATGVCFTLLVGSFHKILTLDMLISVDSSYFNLTKMFENNVINLTDFRLLLDQRLWVYSFAFAVFIWYETMMTINYVRGFEYKYTNSKLECFSLVIGNLVCGVFGLLPLTSSFTTNIQLKGIKSLHRINFLGGLLILLIVPLSIWSFMKYIPVSILPIFYISMLLVEIKKTDFKLLFTYNKTKLFYIILVPLLCFYIDIIYAFVFSMIIYHVNYGYNRGSTYFHFDDVNQFFNRVLKCARENKDKNDEERAVLNFDSEINRLEDDKERIGPDCIVYSLFGKYTYLYSDFHLNIISHREERFVIINFEYIFKQDIDFIANYHKFLKRVQKAGKEVYITGIEKDDFINFIKMFKRSFYSRFYMKNAVYYMG